MTTESISRICSIEGCERKFYGRELCSMHYQRLTKRGTTDPSYKMDDATRFWSKVDKTPGFGPNGDCWRWVPPLQSNGYAQFSINQRPVWAHRFSFFLTHGRYPEPVGRHTCDNPPCVRPDHIIEGTQADNMRDCVERGRSRKGEAVNGSRFTETDIRNMRERRSAGDTFQAIATAYQTSSSWIFQICTRAKWKHVE